MKYIEFFLFEIFVIVCPRCQCRYQFYNYKCHNMAAQVRRTHNHGGGCGPLTASLGSHSILTLTYLNFYNFWKRRKEKWLKVPLLNIVVH